MLSVNRINKSYNLVTILKDITFSLKPGQRLGIVGVNGCGKTTLLKIIMGFIKPDSGSVQFTPADLRVSYLPQGLAPADTDTIDSFLNSHVQSADNLEDALSRVSNALMLDPENIDLHEQYDRILAQLSMKIHSSGSQFEILSSLGLEQYELDMPVKFLSGGQKTRLALSSVLLSNPQLLLLDEPTNHLDIEMLEWFEEWLTRFQGGILMVSHDRAFLDKTANGILRIDTRTHEMKQYAGNYSAYLEQRMAEQEKAWQSYQDQQDEISRLQTTAHRIRSTGNFRKGGKSDTTSGTDGFTAGFFKDRALETMRRAKAIEKKLDLLMGDKHIDKPKSDWEMKMDFRNQAESSRDVLILEDLAIGYDQQPLIEHVNLILRYGQRCALIGPNGIGKTTLLKTITGKIQPLAGHSRLGPNIKMGYMAQEQEDIDPASNPYETIYKRSGMSETETRYFLSKFLFKGDEVFTSNHSLSYGERARLMLTCLVADGCNFLVLDEPINHLDIPSRTQFEQALANFEGTVLAVVHDRYFIDSFATELWKFGGGKIQQIFLD